MKVELDVLRTPTKSFRSMKEGEIGTFEYGGDEVLALRIFDHVVNLRRPGQTWDMDASHAVKLLPPGTKITLTVE